MLNIRKRRGILFSLLILFLLLGGTLASMYGQSGKDTIRPSAAGSITQVNGVMDIVNSSSLNSQPTIRIYQGYSNVTWTCAPNVRFSTRTPAHPSGDGTMYVWESTEADGNFHSNYDSNHNWVEVVYKNAGACDGKSVDVKIKFYWDASNYVGQWFGKCGLRLGRNGDDMSHNASYWRKTSLDGCSGTGRSQVLYGYSWYDLHRLRTQYSFYYSGTGDRIPVTDLYIKAGSLNPGEGIAPYATTQFGVNSNGKSYEKMAGAYPNVYHVPRGTMIDQIPESDSGLWFYDKSYGKRIWDEDMTWVINLVSNNFYDNMAPPENEADDTFWKSCMGMWVHDANSSFTFAYSTSHAWFAPNLTPMGATADEPVKGIVDGNESKTSVTRVAGDEIVFEISQPVEYYGYSGTGFTKYSNFKFVDYLPEGVTYKSARVVRRSGTSVSNYNVTANGSLRYDSTTRCVLFSFNTSYLQGWTYPRMNYMGETYVLQITCTLDDNKERRGSAMSYTLKNRAHTVIQSTRQDTNEVSVTQHYDRMRTYMRWQDVNGNWSAYGLVDEDVICRGHDYSYEWARGTERDEPENIYLDANPSKVGVDASTGSKDFYVSVGRRTYTYSFDFQPPGGHTVSEISNRQADKSGQWAETMSGTAKAPALAGYTFKGWNTKADGSGNTYANEKMLSDKTFYAQWESKKYKVRYDANGSQNPNHQEGEFTQNVTAGVMADSEYAYDTTGALRKNAYTRTGYTFKGWNTKADGTGTSYGDEYGGVLNWTDGGGIVTLYAQWEKKLGEETVTVVDEITGNKVSGVTLKLQKQVNGTWTDIESQTTGDAGTLSLSSLHWFNYRWVMTSVPIGYSLSSSHTAFTIRHNNLTAANEIRLIKIKYKVRYDANGSSNPNHQEGEKTQNVTTGTMADSEYTYGVTGSLRPNAYVREGYTFSGWNTKADGSGTAYADRYPGVYNWLSTNGGIVTLYAQWEKKLGEESLKVISEETGNPVKGVKLKLQKSVNGAWADVANATTGTNGQVDVSGLHWFDYRWVMTEVPAGYVKSADTEFGINYDRLDVSNEVILYMKHVSIKLNSRVSDVIKGENAPAFIYHVKGTDAAGVRHEYSVLVQTDAGTKRGSDALSGIFAGTYEVTQAPVSRYVPGRAEDVSHATANGIGVTADVLNHDSAEATFPYTIREYGWLSGTDSLKNHLSR